MSNLQSFIKQQLEDEDFKREYEAFKPKYEAIRAVIAARIEQNMTQKELSERTGIRQSNISRIESGTTSPTIATLARIAAGLGKELVIEFR
jgi:predicted transcriptional regulator